MRITPSFLGGCYPRAGKTYTLSSIAPDAVGMMPRAAAEVFARIAADASHHHTVFMSYIQIYMELLQARTGRRPMWTPQSMQRGRCATRSVAALFCTCLGMLTADRWVIILRYVYRQPPQLHVPSLLYTGLPISMAEDAQPACHLLFSMSMQMHHMWHLSHCHLHFWRAPAMQDCAAALITGSQDVIRTAQT